MSNQIQSILHDLAKEAKLKTHIASTVAKEVKKAKDNGTFNEEVFFHDIFFTLKELKTVDEDIFKNAFLGYEQAITEDKKGELISMHTEVENLKAQIAVKTRDIKSHILNKARYILDLAKHYEPEDKTLIDNIINDSFLQQAELLGILKEVSESAFVTAIEHKNDIFTISKEMSRNFVYSLVKTAKFEKDKVIQSIKVILSSAISVANEDAANAKDLLGGAILGAYDGLEMCLNKHRNDIKFQEDESLISFKESTDDFIALLKELDLTSDEPAKGIIESINIKNFDNVKFRTKQISQDIQFKISNKMRLEEIGRAVSDKLEFLKNEFSEKGAKLKENLDIDKKLLNFKKDINQLEDIASKKIDSVKMLKNIQDIKEKTSKIGRRAFEAAKKNINKIKKND